MLSTGPQPSIADAGELEPEVLDDDCSPESLHLADREECGSGGRDSHTSECPNSMTEGWDMTTAFDVIAHCTKQFFAVPNNATGTNFVKELVCFCKHLLILVGPKVMPYMALLFYQHSCYKSL